MNEPLVVVGSGPSGVHFAQAAIERGRRVTMLDVGRTGPPPVRPDDDLGGLKEHHPDPVAYFLGRDLASLILPGHAGEYYGFPPGKAHVFTNDGDVDFVATRFEPLFSFARGGLAEAWTGGSYPFTEADLEDFPFGWDDIRPFYEEVARRIGVTGAADDMAAFLPMHEGLQEPLPPDEHAQALLDAYTRRRDRMQTKHGFHLGRSRSAVLSRPLGGRPACDRLGRCLWGCPTGAFYTPSITLAALRESPEFTYVPGVRVEHFVAGDGGRITQVVASDVATDARREFAVGALVLAAGTLCTSKIHLDSLRRAGSGPASLPGLSDNRQILVPFVNMKMLGRRYEARSYQYHQLAFALADADPRQHVHGLVTTLKTALIHPIVQNLPLSLRAGLGAFRDVHAALGLVNLNLPDRRRPENTVGIEEVTPGGPTRLVLGYTPASGEAARIGAAMKRLRAVLSDLGCVAPPGLSHVRPMGASVHYTGTLPMTNDARPGTTDAQCRSRDFGNLWIADGATFPSLPAKNLTFTLMANARRIAAACA